MSTPHRRSSRLRGSAMLSPSVASPAIHKLSSLVERDESPGIDPSINSILASTAPPPKTADVNHGTNSPGDTIIKTPQTASRIYPSLEEMHPSKVQQSPAKQPDSGLRFGFADINSRTTSPSKLAAKAVHSGTPTKSNDSQPNQISSPAFEFKWNRPDSDLSSETQKIMESIRDEAAKLKVQMQQERDEQARKDEETDQLYGVGRRKIAKLKGRGTTGRYSDVHMQEFKKMDSIAGHVSAWKNKIQGNSSVSPKRSKSKAGFDEPELSTSRTGPIKSLKGDQNCNRLESMAPGKRVKQNYHDDTSVTRPSSRDSRSHNQNSTINSSLPRSKNSMPSVMTTPTQASLARAASIKQSKLSKIPSLGRSKSIKKSISQSSKVEGSYKYLPSLPRFGSMKSILHKSQPKFSDDPAKVAAGTHVPLPIKHIRLDKELPSIPGTPSTESLRSPSFKHVDFTPITKSKYELAAVSPSPSKIFDPHITHQDAAASKTTDNVGYPLLAKIGPLTSNPTQPGDFTFRSTKTVQIGPATSGLKSPTIRQVRPSGVATPLSAFDNLPAVPHGMPNKKRRCPESDEENIENLDPREAANSEEGPRLKKQKGISHVGSGLSNGSYVGGTKKKAGSKIAKPGNAKVKGRGVLSLSRLNMLARPKERR